MKQCKRCAQEYQETDFPSSGYHTRVDGSKVQVYKPVCKKCLVIEQTEKYYALWNKYCGNSCSRCGYNKCQAALELHHINAEEKDFTPAARRSISEQRFADEVSKCIVLCSNCHREIHEEEKLGV